MPETRASFIDKLLNVAKGLDQEHVFVAIDLVDHYYERNEPVKSQVFHAGLVALHVINQE